MKNKPRYSPQEAAKLVKAGCKLAGNTQATFSHARPVTEADAQSIVWINPVRTDKDELAARTQGSVIVCDPSVALSPALLSKKCVLVVDDPRLAFTEIVTAFFVAKNKPAIDKTARLHKNARIGKGCTIGPNTVIGNAVIGNGAVIDGQCFIYDGVTIGKNVKIKAGCVIGGYGFGYFPDAKGKLINFPHIGTVEIGDDVEIGSNITIDRAALGTTRLGNGVKVDNLSHIAHNVVIGANTIVMAGVTIAGSVTIGKDCRLSPGCSIRDWARIGDGATVGLGAAVQQNVPANETWTGVPAMPKELFGTLRYKIQRLIRKAGDQESK